ncbi:MAG: hypothetical protein H0W40_09005 [Methylibium sp.]|uniref:hypothetical protein n=1 Tax=Methylibium sp. TaxID=2067992 RepID=UPI00185714F3|nr:hypothetical protein [Methylibium sp.]MBA3597504.1 hypothetical protein [Methylibium sp.]
MLEKIHAALWDALKRNFEETAEVTHAFGPDLVFRPFTGAQKVSLHFEQPVGT